MRIAVPAARLKEIWDYLLTDIEKAGSIGKLLKDDINVALSVVDGHVDDLEGRLTAARALLLDNLDKAISALNDLPASSFPSADIEKLDDVTGDLAPTVTGTMSNPEYAINNDTAQAAWGTEIGQYVELTFKIPFLLLGYRFFKRDTTYTSPENALVKIEYYDGAAWHDWVTDISVEDTGEWVAWAFPDSAVVKGKKLRITITGLDDQPRCGFGEVELYGLCAYHES